MIAALLWGLLCPPVAHALAITSAATGNWNAVTTWAIVTAGIPGRITTSTASTTVTGNASTLFLQLKPGDQLYTTGNVLVGTINSVASNTSLTLNANAAVNLANALYRIRKVPDANDAANAGTTATHVVTVPAGYAAQVGALTIGATTQNNSAVTLAAANSSLNAGAVTINRTSNTPRTHALNVNAGTATLASLAITGGTGSRAGELAISTGIATVTGAITFSGTAGNARITFSDSGTLRVRGSLATGGTLTPSTGTVEYDGAGAQTVQSGYAYYNLTLSTGGTKAPSAGTVTVGGTLTLNSGVTYDGTTNNPAVNVAGDFSNSGTFNSGTGLFTFAGTNHALTGTNANTTFTNLRINSTGSLTLGQDATVNGTLDFSDGRISTGASNVILGSAGTIAGPSATSYVVGNFRKTYAAAANLNYAGDDFPVGDATNYTPVNITAGTTTAAGTLTVSTTPTDHPQVTTPILSTGIDANLSVNRYWTFVSNGVATGTDIAATFNFIAGTPVDLDAGAQTFNFIVQRYDQTFWHQTTLNAASGDNTQVSGIAIGTGTHDFAIGQPLPGGAPAPVGRFNVFQSSTPANDLEGPIYTKLAGVSVNDLDIIHINAGKNNLAGGSVTVEIELLDSSTGGATNDDGCSTTDAWPSVQTLPPFTFTGRGTLPAFTPTNAYRNLRFRVRYPVGGPYTRIGCSPDNFAVRPVSFSITSTMNNAGTSGAPAIATGASFTIDAAAVARYDGAPAIDAATMLSHTAGAAGTLGGTFGAANPVTGTASGNAFTYSEVGNFTFGINGVYDDSFTLVDQIPGHCTNDFSNSQDGSGKYGCKFGNTATSAAIGRFFPDHFTVTATGAVVPACIPPGPAVSYTYLGENFAVSGVTVEARNADDVKTIYYDGSFAQHAPATFSTWGFGARDTLAALDLSSRITGGTVTGTWTNGALASDFSGIKINRAAAPDGPLTSVVLGIAIVDPDGVALQPGALNLDVDGAGGDDHKQLGGPGEFRFGRLRMQNALASSGAIALPVPMETQYWSGTLFVLNSDDSCMTLPAVNVGLSDYRLNLNSPETAVTPTPDITFTGGRGDLKLSPPGAANNGSVLVTPDLAAADRPYLQGAWTGATYTENPSARASFGLFGSQPRNFIFQRENY